MLTLPDSKPASARGGGGLGEVRRSVTGGKVAKMPGGEPVGKWRVMWGLDVGVPGREAMDDYCESIRELSTWLIGLR